MSNKLVKDGEDTFVMYGVTEDRIVEATHLDLEDNKDGLVLDGVSVSTVFTIENNRIVYFKSNWE